MRNGGPDLPRTAQELGISARSLQRRLADNGTSYSELVMEVRIGMACHLLVETDDRIRDVAARLGFADPGSFTRAFLRLMKVQPVIYRRQRRSPRAESK
jgi:AraC-like DNA-binding protein